MTTLSFALVGCGRIALRHAQLLGTGKIPGAILAAVCDTDFAKASILSDKYNVPAFPNMHKMASKTDIDVFVILTESGYHADHVLQLVQYKKHIIVEKPMALRLSDADMIIEACDTAGIKLFVVKQNRFNLPILKLREAIDSNRFGKLTLGTVRVRWCRPQSYYDLAAWRGTWELDGGVLANQASHHIDMLTWMMGSVDSVFCQKITRLANIEAEDTAVATLNFTNGALGVVEATTATRPKDLEGSISILGEYGTVEIGGFAMNEIKTWSFDTPTDSDFLMKDKFSCNPPDVYGFGHQKYYEHVVQAIVHGGPNLIDGFSGRKSLELINAFYESSETARPVYLRFNPKNIRLGSQS